MNQYILHHVGDYCGDEGILKILTHTSYLFRHFHPLLNPSKNDGSFFYFKELEDFRWDLVVFMGGCYKRDPNLLTLAIKAGATKCAFCDRRPQDHL